MKRQIGIPFVLWAAWLIASAFIINAHADTSYLLIQGPFGGGGSEVTYKWQVNYPAGYLTTSQDLLNAVFGGVPVADGTLQGDSTFGPAPVYKNGSSQNGGLYVYYPPDPPDFPEASFLTYAFTLRSTTVSTDDNVSIGQSTLGWNFYVEGGDASDNGEWNYSEEGQSSRLLSNDSYDGWVFGDTGSDPDFTPVGTTATIDDSSDSDDPSDFSNNGADDILMIVDIPEPGTAALLGIALAALAAAAFRKREGRA
jgi:hypothetical protein